MQRNKPALTTKSHKQPAAQQYAGTAESEGDDEYLPLHTVGGGATPPIKVPTMPQ